jgi:hypothetical protein
VNTATPYVLYTLADRWTISCICRYTNIACKTYIKTMQADPTEQGGGGRRIRKMSIFGSSLATGEASACTIIRLVSRPRRALFICAYRVLKCMCPKNNVVDPHQEGFFNY